MTQAVRWFYNTMHYGPFLKNITYCYNPKRIERPLDSYELKYDVSSWMLKYGMWRDPGEFKRYHEVWQWQ